MASCDQGYLCDVCQDEVESLSESELYLRYVIGEIQARALLTTPERHIRCDPYIAQFIQDERFSPVVYSGAFSKEALDAEEAARLTDLYTRGWQRLQEVQALGLPISEYPLKDLTGQTESSDESQP